MSNLAKADRPLPTNASAALGLMESTFPATNRTDRGEGFAGAFPEFAAYIDSHPKGEFGVHGYDLGEFGLDGDELAERFAGYVARHDIPTERAAQMT